MHSSERFPKNDRSALMTAERVKAMRNRLKETQVEFAARLGVKDPGTVSRWERGVMGFDPDSVAKLDELEKQLKNR